MSVQLGFGIAPDAKSAAAEFIALLKGQVDGIKHLSEEIALFDSDNKKVASSFKAISSSGQEVVTTLKQVQGGYELLGQKVDGATNSLKALQQQEKAAAAAAKAAALKADAGVAEATLGPSVNKVGLNPNQINATQAALQNVKALIESGTVSLARFQTIYAQIVSNPKSIIPNLSQDEGRLANSLRSLTTGFDNLGRGAKGNLERISISWQGLLRLFEAQVVKRITGSLQSAFVEGVSAAQDFSVKVAEIQTISQQSGLSADQWASSLRGLSTQFGNSQADVAEAAYQALSNQVTKGADTVDFLAQSAKFSKAAVVSLADSVSVASTVIKAYNVPVAETNQVFATFFKTIELGRLRGTELAQTLGQVAPVASQLGVSYQELGAAFATVTSLGNSQAEATTLISNILQKLIKPTDEMKTLFDEWGVASGEAAIATFGFEGVLAKLNQEAQKGSTRIGELLGQIRAIKGVAALSGNNFGTFQANLEEIKNAAPSYEAAADIVAKSFGDRLKVQVNQVKVFFAEEFGDSIVKTLVNVTESLGGAANILRTFASVLKPIVTLIGPIAVGAAAAKIAISTWSVATGVFTTSQVASTIAVQSAAVAQLELAVAAGTATQAQLQAAQAALALTTANNALFAGILQFAGFFAVGYTIGQYIWSPEDEARGRRITSELRKQAEAKFKFRTGSDPEAINQKAILNDTKDSFDGQFKIINNFYNQKLKLSTEAKNKAVENLKQETDQTKLAAKAYTEGIQANVSTLRQSVAESKAIIDASLKSSESLAKKSIDNIYQVKTQFASEGFIGDGGFVVNDQKVALLQNRIKEIEGYAQQELQKGTKESLAEARKFYDELRTLESQLFGQQESVRKRNIEEGLRRGTIQPNSETFDPITGQVKTRYEYTVNTAAYEQKINAIKREQLGIEQQIRAVEEAKKAAKEKEIQSEKQKRDAVQQSFSAIEKLSATDASGKVKSEFKGFDVTKGFDGTIVKVSKANQLLDEFDRRAESIKKAISGSDVQTQATIFDVLARQRAALGDQISKVSTDQSVRDAYNGANVQAKKIAGEVTDIQNKLDAGNNKIKLGLTELQTELTAVTKAGKPSLESERDTPGITANFRKRNEAVQSALDAFDKNSSAENLNALKEAFAAFEKQYENASDIIGNSNLGLKISQQISEAKKALELIESGKAETSKAAGDTLKLRESGQRLGTNLSEVPGLFDSIFNRAEEAAPKTITQIDSISASVDMLSNNIRNAANALRQLSGEAPSVVDAASKIANGITSGAGGIPTAMYGGPVKYMATGGYVGRGSDTQPVMADPAEFMMNAMATRQFSPILQAMNSMRSDLVHTAQPITSVGDITVNVNGGASDYKTVRNIGKGLQREIRRGTIGGLGKGKK